MARTRYMVMWLMLLILCICYSNAGFPDFIEKNGLSINGYNVCKHPKSRQATITTPIKHVITTKKYMGTCNKTIWLPWLRTPSTVEVPCILFRFITNNETVDKVYHGYSLKCCLHWTREKPGDTDCKKRFPDFIEKNGLSIDGSNVCKHPISREENITIPIKHVVTKTYMGICNRTFMNIWLPWIRKPIVFQVPCVLRRLITKTINETMEKVYHGYSLKCCLHWDREKLGDTDCKKPICPNGCGNGRCIAGDTCHCDQGWQGYTCNHDVNECYSQNGGCQQECYNKLGSHECVCRKGYTPDTNQPSKCIDINECKASKPKCVCAGNNLQCKPSCVNNIGGFQCQCPKGYRLHGLHTCIDVDECLSAQNCQQRCINAQGSYRCDCFKGMTFVRNKNTCEDINECRAQRHGCEQVCLNTYSSYRCRCKLGYRLAPDRKKCIKFQVPE